MKKLKILLCGYVNYPNAQNINCDNIAKFLNKDQFEVHVMYTSKREIDKSEYKRKNIHLHKWVQNRLLERLSQWLIMVVGKYDIYYMPKRTVVETKFAKRYSGKKCMISSVEGVVFKNLRNDKNTHLYMKEYMTSVFTISKCIADSVKKYWGITTAILPLGVVDFRKKYRTIESLNNIVWVGNFKENKRPYYIVECAEYFPDIQFTMIGDGVLFENIKKEILERHITNIRLLGRLSNEEVYEYMSKAELLLMTSKNEGVPKVIQEAAQCSLPSIYIGEFYDVDFIENGVNGYKVYNFGEMIEKIQILQKNSALLKELSVHAYETAQKFTWEKLIPQYEKFFKDTYEKFIMCKK